MSTMLWREASTLLVMALKPKPFTSLYNYNVMMLKRSDKSSFMPSGFVFPGGGVDKTDNDPKWIQFFEKYAVGKPLQNIPSDRLPPIFGDEKVDVSSKDIALRVSAIRETFEETGVLLCRQIGQGGTAKKTDWAEAVPNDDLSEWRAKVQKHPQKFLEMCSTLNCIPDVWSLKLWGNWLTPPDFKKRFDTVFYTTCLSSQPVTVADQTEIEQVAWYSPEKLLALSLNGELWLPPPQLYELSRILQFSRLEDLKEFSYDREILGCERYNASRFKTKDGLVFPLPGDTTYNIEDNDQYKDQTFRDARINCTSLHRMEIHKSGKCEIVCSNVTLDHGHVLPRIEEGVQSKSNI